MLTAIVHLSDFHNVQGQDESHRLVADAFLTDLQQQLKEVAADNCYLAFSGDIAQSADQSTQYEDFKLTFDERLSALGIPKSNRILVPGNHDVSQLKIQENLVLHEGVVSQKLNEKEFNNFITQEPAVMSEKFQNYLAFQATFADIGIGPNGATGAGWELDGDVGVYCLNTAVCSSGGLKKDGVPLADKRRLNVDTRNLHAWVRQSKSRWKILVMHHPMHWLTVQAEQELKAIVKKHFSLRLYGHEHEQDALHATTPGHSLLECCAPALFTRKDEELGYSIITVDNRKGIRELIYRQWTKFQTFVAGVSFSNTNNGRIAYHCNLLEQLQATASLESNFILRHLESKLDQALRSFSGQPKVWVAPIVKSTPEIEKDEDPQPSVDLGDLVGEPISTLFKAPPQFGLTCLARYLIKEAWRTSGSLWIYLDASLLKPHAASITEAVASELSITGLAKAEVKCVILDSLSGSNDACWKVLDKVVLQFPGVPVLAMESTDGTFSGFARARCDLPIQFRTLYLHALSREKIREIVVGYNDTRPIGEEDVVISRIASDLEVLNLHRTPLNCMTLLKASEMDFDESPVNRSEMIKRILFLLFNADSLPTYKARPDLKDCEYVLGYFCELMLKQNLYIFSRSHFLRVLQDACRDRLIDLEVHVVFDVLSANNILVGKDGQFCFRFSFWIYYFAALRMQHNPEFAAHIFADRRYVNHPELIEFYTGIDRQKGDALLVLTRDVKAIREEVEKKCGFPKEMDPYKFLQWTPSTTALEQMKTELENGVKESSLPAEFKDQFADRTYDVKRPYDQSVNALTDHSVELLMRALRGACRALRNSDYVNAPIKRALLQEILLCWEQLSVVLMVLMPFLARTGRAAFDGTNFALKGDFGATVEDRLRTILIEIPGNVVDWSRDDLFSHKMGPLLIDVADKERGDLRKHELLRLLVTQRPRGWAAAVQAYIASIPKNSFYLMDVYRALRVQYRYSYASPQTLKEMVHLISMAMTKHLTGHKDPGPKLIQKTMADVRGDPVIPPRQV